MARTWEVNTQPTCSCESAGKLVKPKIYEDGGISPWPGGFFDQAEKDLMELF